MIVYLPLLFLSVVFFELFRLMKLGANAKAIVMSSREAMRVLAASDIPDEEKERCMRRGSLEILKSTLSLAAKFGVTCAILFALFELIVRVFPDLRQPLIDSLLSPIVLIVLTVAVLAYAWARRAAART